MHLGNEPHEHEHTHSHMHTHDGVHYHEHEHTHTHTHDGEHMEGHEHDHPHTHEGEHSHDHAHGISPKDELIALVRYMIDHNSAHADELVRLAEKAEGMGAKAADEKILEAVGAFRQGNAMLTEALALLK